MSKLHQVALTFAKNIGPTLAKSLVSYLGDPEEIFKVPKGKLMKVPGIGEKTAQRLISDHGSVKAVMLAKNLPAPLRKKLVAAQDYIEACRAVMFPVRDLPLPEISLELPKKVRDAAFLHQAAEEHNLGGSITRLCAVLGFEA